MLINNRLDRSFGKAGIFPGIILIVFGCLGILYFWPVILIITGAFFVFTHSGVMIDTEKRKIRLYQNLFGVIKTGKWVPLNQFTGLTIIPVKRYSRVMSMSNRSTTLEEKDFRIFLLNKKHKPEIVIKKCKTPEDARDRIDELALWLKLPVYSLK